jgi:hypothetical protein
MRGLGTIINIILIFLAGTFGCTFSSKMKEKMQETLFLITGIAVIFVGIAGAMEQMLMIENDRLIPRNIMMVICCLAIGAIVGEYFDLDGKMNQFADYVKKKSNNGNDTKFVVAFVNTSCVVCIGAMAVIGAIKDGVSGDITVLAAKGVIDFILVSVMSASLGKGCMFSAIPVAIFQGSITLLAMMLNTVVPAVALENLSCVGSILIFCVGVNMVFERKMRVANVLPAVIIAVIWGMIF